MPFITTKSGFKINYAIYGDPDAKHTLLLSHGNGNCLDDWQALGYIRNLVPPHRIIAMDALGYGRSDKPYDPEQYSAKKRAEDVISLMDALQIDKCHFFGNSIGGSLGFVLAALYQHRFYSFIIGSAHPYGSTRPCSNLWEDEAKKLLGEMSMPQFVAHIEKHWLKRTFPAGVRENFISNDSKAIIVANTLPWPDFSAALSSIFVPVILFAGENDPVAQYVVSLSDQIKFSEVHILKRKDHAQTYWESDDIALLINSFLNARA